MIEERLADSLPVTSIKRLEWWSSRYIPAAPYSPGASPGQCGQFSHDSSIRAFITARHKNPKESMQSLRPMSPEEVKGQ